MNLIVVFGGGAAVDWRARRRALDRVFNGGKTPRQPPRAGRSAVRDRPIARRRRTSDR
jgi:hypothetical protein